MRTWVGFVGLFAAVGMTAGCALAQEAGVGGGTGWGGSGGWLEPGVGQTWATDATAGGGAGGTTSGASSSGTTAGSGGFSDPTLCTYANEPAVIHLAFPGWRTLVSPVLARALTHAGKVPSPAVMNTTEFLTYYEVHYDDAAPPDQTSFHVGARAGDAANDMLIQIAVQAPSMLARQKVALGVVVDTSLSMAGGSFKRAKASAEALARALQIGDKFFLVTGKRGATDVLEINTEADRAEALARAQAITLDAGEDLGGALLDAYDKIGALGLDSGQPIGRVMLISDGAAAPASLDLARVHTAAKSGVPLIGVAVPEPTDYNANFWDIVTLNGNGAAVFIDTDPKTGDPNAAPVLESRFAELVTLVASDVNVDVVLGNRLRFVKPEAMGIANTDSGLVTANLMAGRTLIARGTVETCAPSIDDVTDDVVTVTVHYTPAGGAAPNDFPVSRLVGDLLKTDQKQILKADAIMAYAEATTTLRAAVYEDAATKVGAALALGSDTDLDEIQQLITEDVAILNASAATP